MESGLALHTLFFYHRLQSLDKYTVKDCICKEVGGGQQWFNFTDAVDKSYYTGSPSDPLGGGMGGANAAAMWNAGALPLFGASSVEQGASGCCDASDAVNGGIGASGNPNTSAFTTAGGGKPLNPWAANAAAGIGQINLFDSGYNCTKSAKIQLNGHDRFCEREGRYFNLVQPYQHHTNVPATGINVYSFALKPEEHQPSGTCNMSRIDNATLQLTLTSTSVNGPCGNTPQTVDVYVYATNYNVLRIMSGMGGLAYSN